jgi:hypothetical protein
VRSLTLPEAFDEWVADIKALNYDAGDFDLPFAALVGIYQAVLPDVPRTVYDFNQAIMDHPAALRTAGRLILGDYEEDVTEFCLVKAEASLQLPDIEGSSSIRYHLRKALSDGRPETDDTLSVADWHLVHVIGKAAYDYLVGFEPLRFFHVSTAGRPYLGHLPKSQAIINSDTASRIDSR